MWFYCASGKIGHRAGSLTKLISCIIPDETKRSEMHPEPCCTPRGELYRRYGVMYYTSSHNHRILWTSSSFYSRSATSARVHPLFIVRFHYHPGFQPFSRSADYYSTLTVTLTIVRCKSKVTAKDLLWKSYFQLSSNKLNTNKSWRSEAKFKWCLNEVKSLVMQSKQLSFSYVFFYFSPRLLVL